MIFELLWAKQRDRIRQLEQHEFVCAVRRPTGSNEWRRGVATLVKGTFTFYPGGRGTMTMPSEAPWSVQVVRIPDPPAGPLVGPRLNEFLGRPRTHTMAFQGPDGHIDVAVPDRDRSRVADAVAM